VWVRLVGVGLRRIAVTPTFAAGLGVVIAAVIAYPLTRAVISYVPEPPAAGHRCPVVACATAAPDSGGLATAKPGLRMPSPRPTPQRHLAMPAPPAAASPRPVMTYQTLRQWTGGFEAEVTIALPTGPPPASWRLRLSYRSAVIDRVWGGAWTARSPHVAIVTPLIQGQPGRPGVSPGADIRIYLEVTGVPRPPTGCELNGQHCTRG
jgi:hypothetical protein